MSLSVRYLSKTECTRGSVIIWIHKNLSNLVLDLRDFFVETGGFVAYSFILALIFFENHRHHYELATAKHSETEHFHRSGIRSKERLAREKTPRHRPRLTSTIVVAHHFVIYSSSGWCRDGELGFELKLK